MLNVNVKILNISKEYYVVSNICFIVLIINEEFFIYGYWFKRK